MYQGIGSFAAFIVHTCFSHVLYSSTVWLCRHSSLLAASPKVVGVNKEHMSQQIRSRVRRVVETFKTIPVSHLDILLSD